MSSKITMRAYADRDYVIQSIPNFCVDFPMI